MYENSSKKICRGKVKKKNQEIFIFSEVKSEIKVKFKTKSHRSHNSHRRRIELQKKYRETIF